jgi:hypothetical protein
MLFELYFDYKCCFDFNYFMFFSTNLVDRIFHDYCFNRNVMNIISRRKRTRFVVFESIIRNQYFEVFNCLRLKDSVIEIDKID